MDTGVTSADLCHLLRLGRQSLAGLVERSIIVRGERCEMDEKDVSALAQMLRAIALLTDAELLQLKAAARKEAEKRSLKPSRHATNAGARGPK
jgi:hypothetical protein